MLREFEIRERTKETKEKQSSIHVNLPSTALVLDVGCDFDCYGCSFWRSEDGDVYYVTTTVGRGQEKERRGLKVSRLLFFSGLTFIFFCSEDLILLCILFNHDELSLSSPFLSV